MKCCIHQHPFTVYTIVHTALLVNTTELCTLYIVHCTLYSSHLQCAHLTQLQCDAQCSGNSPMHLVSIPAGGQKRTVLQQLSAFSAGWAGKWTMVDKGCQSGRVRPKRGPFLPYSETQEGTLKMSTWVQHCSMNKDAYRGRYYTLTCCIELHELHALREFHELRLLKSFANSCVLCVMLLDDILAIISLH